MNKTIYIGEVPQDYLEMGGSEGLFKKDGRYYYYTLEFDLEDGCARLTDTCNRMMPLDMTNYMEIATALDAVANFQEQFESLKEQMDGFIDTVPPYMRVVLNDDFGDE